MLALVLLFCIISTTLQSESPMDILEPYPRFRRSAARMNNKADALHAPCSLINNTADGNNHIFVTSTTNRSETSIEVKAFEWKSPSRYYRPLVRGHAVRVPHPNAQVSIRHAGCRKHLRKTVSLQVAESERASHCTVATNAGFFNTRDGSCYGNLISFDEPVLNFSSYRNAHFGVLQDGRLFFGYVTEEIFRTVGFRHLVGGVIWLLKNGSVSIEESIALECESVEETGTLRYFADVISARTAIGSDAQGRVWMVHVDGRTSQFGVNLWQMAELLRDQFQIVNAINLDGGGSSTMVWRDTVINYPSDRCPEQKFLCERPVTSIVCASDDVDSDDNPFSSSTVVRNTALYSNSWLYGLLVILTILVCVSVLVNVFIILCPHHKLPLPHSMKERQKSASIRYNAGSAELMSSATSRFIGNTTSIEVTEEEERGALLVSEDEMCSTVGEFITPESNKLTAS